MAEPSVKTGQLLRERGLQAELFRARRASRGGAPVLQDVDPDLEPTRFGKRYGALEQFEEGMKEQAGGAAAPYQYRGERREGGRRLLRGGRELYSRIRSEARGASGGLESASDEAAGGNRERLRDLSPAGRLGVLRRSRAREQEDPRAPSEPEPWEEEAMPGKPAESTNEMEAFMKKWIGAMWIRTCWMWLWPSFGHSIYLINITFFIGFMSKFARRWIPEVGAEWFYISPGMRVGAGGAPQKGRSSKASRAGTKAAVMVVKVGELGAMGLITFLVAMFDIFVILVLMFIILTIEKIVSIIPGL